METSATSAAPSTAPAPRLRLTLVDDDADGAQKYDADVDSNWNPTDPPAERQASNPANTCAAANASSRAEAYLEQEGQKASHVFAGLTTDPDETSSENDTSSSEDICQRSLTLAKSGCLVLDCPCPSSLTKSSNTCKNLPFRYGGLELRVNSRSLEVYITEQSTSRANTATKIGACGRN